METLERLPFKARKAVFDRLEKLASMANLTPSQRNQYEMEWAAYNDYYNTVDFAKQRGIRQGRKEGRKEGRQEGREEGRREQQRLIAASLKAQGIPLLVISTATRLSLAEIEEL